MSGPTDAGRLFFLILAGAFFPFAAPEELYNLFISETVLSVTKIPQIFL